MKGKKAFRPVVGLVLALAMVPPGNPAPSQIARPFLFDPDPFTWPVAAPEEQGLDSDIFEDALREAGKLPFLYGLLVVQGGRLIAEGYFHGQDPYQAHSIASSSKSFISALVGLAVNHGFLTTLDQKMMDFFPEFRTAVPDPRKFQITLRQLLQMRAGYPYDSTDSFWNAWVSTPSLLRMAVVETALEADPGTRWNYSTASTHILSAVIARATGMSTKDFADRFLFTPMGITIADWKRDVEGYYKGGWDMFLTPRDMALFGLLYLHNGILDGNPILPGDWIAESLRDYSLTYFESVTFENVRYGYLWYHANAAGYEIFYTQGHGGNNIVIVPELDLVVVTTATIDNGFAAGWENSLRSFQLIARNVLAPIRGGKGGPPFPPASLSSQKVENRGFAYREYLNVLTWRPQPRNENSPLRGYRIYYLLGLEPWLMAEVGPAAREYRHRRVDPVRVYNYAVTAVFADGRESSPAYTSVEKAADR